MSEKGILGLFWRMRRGRVNARLGLKYQNLLPLRSVPVVGRMLNREVETMDARKGWGKVPASQRRRHGNFSVFHFRQTFPNKDEEGADI